MGRTSTETEVKDPTIVSRLVDQQRNFASVQTKVSPLKIVMDKKRPPLIKRKTTSPLRQVPQKNIRLDEVSLVCSEEDSPPPSPKRIKLEKMMRVHDPKPEKTRYNRYHVNEGVISKQRKNSEEQRRKSGEELSYNKKPIDHHNIEFWVIC